MEISHFKNRKQLFEASDEEVESFFENARFEGIFSSEIRNTNHPEYFKGSVTDIKLNGIHYDYLPQYLNIPKMGSYVSAGACTFKCRVNAAALHGTPKKLILTVIGNSVETISDTFRPSVQRRKERTKEEALFLRNLKLRDNLFIGQFTMNRDGSFTIRDIRRSDFSKLILQNGKEQTPIVYHPKMRQPEDGKYYEFAWVLNKVVMDDYIYNFKVDESKPFKEINAKELINRLHNDIMSYPAGAGQKIVKMLDTLKTQLTASGKEIFIYELLQNANDYPVKGDNNVAEKVDVEFRITADSLIFMHSGAKFNERNIAAICSINDKEKTENKEAIGYKGIGFKTVFLDNNYVYLQTGDFSFRFDREATRDIVDTPWQILPIWTTYNKLTKSEKYVFTNADSKFRVKFALRPTNIETLRGEGQNYVKLFQKVFENERVILFIPNLSSVKVFYNYTDDPDIECRCDSDKWRVDNFEEPVNPDITTQINDDIDKQEDTGSLKIPTKYYDFTRTKVSFACEVKGSQLDEVDDTLLYCYLPTKASWGFKFLMNTDMIPTGPRDDIEIDFNDQININAEISEIAGKKFFEWIRKLCDEKIYTLTSIFNLIPVFDTCIKEHGKYRILIERFKCGFDAQIEAEELIPVAKDEYELLANTILDETGLMSSGIMSDEDFFRITGIEGKLPILVLRKDSTFRAFQKRYLKQLDCTDNIWTKDDLKDLCSDEDFRTWLSVQENNDKFLKFLLDKGYLEDFIEEDIFLEEDGSLYTADELYYDVDEYLDDLQAFKDKIPVLSHNTRNFFSNNEQWADVVDGEFKTFDSDKWVDDILLSTQNIEETKERLKDIKTSILFYKFLSGNVQYCDRYLSLPFFADDDTVREGFEDGFVFFSSERGKLLFSEKWLSEVSASFLSDKYLPETIEYFRSNFGVRDFSDEIVVKDIILSDDFHDDINNEIQDLETSKQFVDYCYSQKELFSSGDLRKYSLHVFDGDGDEAWCLSEEHIYLQSDSFDDYSSKEWIAYNWMYALDEAYQKGQDNNQDFKDFLSRCFWVDDITDKAFYKNVVKKNLPLIFKSISGSNDSDGSKNLDFIKYLDNNYQLIFVEEKDYDVFDGLKVVTSENGDIDVNHANLYLFDSELDSIISKSWFPSNAASMCRTEYGTSESLKAMGVKSYTFGEFYDDVIVVYLSQINKEISTKEDSVDFHNLIIDHIGSLTSDQLSKMTDAKVYLYGQDAASNCSGGHKTLSAKAKELFENGLVEFSDLDIIDPEYKTEENVNYWETNLGNSKFTVNHFFSWLDDNVDSFNKTLQDESLNIVFWRWLKSNVGDKLIEQASNLPVILKNGSIDNIGNTIYFADEYLEGAGIEETVKVFDKSANFISPSYISEGENVSDWKKFWEKVGIKHEIVDILDHTVIRNLSKSKIEVENLPRLLSENREALEKRYPDGLIAHLHSLRVKARDGYYDIADAIYVNCEKEEPFTFIELPNQITYATSEERRLIQDVIKDVNGTIIEDLSDWQQYKLNRYLSMQDEDIDSVRYCHYQLIEALSAIRNNGHESLRELEKVEDILILDKNEEFCKASSLTMGSVYNPFFDFESCGINAEYVSDSYNSKSKEYVGRLFRSMGVHHDFRKEDVALLAERDCSIYFWTKYLTKPESATRIDDIKRYINDGLFNDIACIPTKDYMKKPCELYYGSEVNRYIKYIEDAENKTPLADIPEFKTSDDKTLFSYLPFRESLDFLDALYATFTLRGQDSRVQLLEWMVDSYDESYESKIGEYRNDVNAVWKNNKNTDVQIKELYALDYSDKTLDQYFGTNARIINKAYLPTGDYYDQACDILRLNIITSDDLKMEPIEDVIYNNRNVDLKLYALVIAGISDSINWKEKYDSFCEKLDSLCLHKCRSILITYKDDTDINQSFRKFYHKDGTDDFYFVDSLDNKHVFILFVNEYKKYLGITDAIIEQDLVLDVMDSRENAINLVKEQNSLMLDDDFVAELVRLVPSEKGQFYGNKAIDDEPETVINRPTFTTKKEEPQTDIPDEDEGYGEIEDEEVYGNGQEEQVVHNPRPSNGMERETEVKESPEEMESVPENEEKPFEHERKQNVNPVSSERNPEEGIHDTPKVEHKEKGSEPEDEQYIGDIEKNPDFEPLGGTPHKPSSNRRRHPKPFTKEELDRLRSNNSPLELESLEPTDIEINILAQQCGITVEQIADTNYLAQLRLYNNLVDVLHEEPEESLEEFVRNADDVSTHRMKSGKFIHACSAARGVMYISPSVWNKMVDDKWAICVYLDGKGKNFHYINSSEDFLKLVEKDDVVIKITGKEKVSVVEQLYGQSGLLNGVKGTAYTLIRVAARTNMDAVFAHYVGAMAESEDGNENSEDY